MDASLQRLAEACGVATTYEDWARRPVEVGEETVRRVLAGLGIDASDPGAALTAWKACNWERVLPPTVVVRRNDPKPVPLRCSAKALVRVEIQLAGDSGREADRHDAAFSSPVEREGPLVERLITIPAGLPLGEHRLVAFVEGESLAEALLIVAPDQLPLPAERIWGWAAQLYAVRSAWGMGDYADLAELARWSAAQGAGLLLVNPLHASTPVPPLQNSPYFPASRRFSSPLYLRPQELPEYVAASDEIRPA